jgi:hypothetical protein
MSGTSKAGEPLALAHLSKSPLNAPQSVLPQPTGAHSGPRRPGTDKCGQVSGKACGLRRLAVAVGGPRA